MVRNELTLIEGDGSVRGWKEGGRRGQKAAAKVLRGGCMIVLWRRDLKVW